MKKMFAKSVVRSLVAATVLALVAQVALAQAPPEKGKIYMLTVWTGTSRNSTDTVPGNADHTRNKAFHDAVVSSQKLFSEQLTGMGLDVKDKNLIAKNVSLEGADTSQQKIVDTVYELSQEAGEEDALFVYIQSHGAAIDPELNYNEPRDETVELGFDREHYILPLIENPVADAKRDGILRSNILYYMRTKKHRLNVLITDSCSAVAGDELKIARMTPVLYTTTNKFSASPAPSSYALRYLLTHATGTVSWNSTCPCFCYAVRNQEDLVDSEGKYRAPKTGDVVLVKPDVKSASQNFEMSRALAETGTIFNMAFVTAAARTVKQPESGYSFDDFFQDLGNDYDVMYEKYLLAQPSRLVDIATTQAFTTLTSFNVEDDHTGDIMMDQKVAAKTNNRVKEAYKHKDSRLGSGKTNSSTLNLEFTK